MEPQKRLVWDEALTASYLSDDEMTVSRWDDPAHVEESAPMGVKLRFSRYPEGAGRDRDYPIKYGDRGVDPDHEKVWRKFRDATRGIKILDGSISHTTEYVFERRWVEYVTRWNSVLSQILTRKRFPVEFGVQQRSVDVAIDIAFVFEGWRSSQLEL